jgi:hypothetical protein
LLEVPQENRQAGASRRLATLMKELGWTPINARGLTSVSRYAAMPKNNGARRFREP